MGAVVWAPSPDPLWGLSPVTAGSMTQIAMTIRSSHVIVETNATSSRSRIAIPMTNLPIKIQTIGGSFMGTKIASRKTGSKNPKMRAKNQDGHGDETLESFSQTSREGISEGSSSPEPSVSSDSESSESSDASSRFG